jgi:hypothetical protein
MLYLLLMIQMFCVESLTGQVQPEWVARYNGPGNNDDSAYDIAVDHSGNVYVTGVRAWGAGASQDYVTIKYDSNGNKLWAAEYNGPGNATDLANAIDLDDDGNVYVTFTDFATIKYDKDGNELWVARFDGTTSAGDEATDILVDRRDGSIYVTGNSDGGWITSADYVTIKYDNDGNEIWNSKFNGMNTLGDWPKALCVDDSGYVYVTGYTEHNTWLGYFNYATIKYDPANGNELWVSEYDGPRNHWDYAFDIGVDNSGHVYVTGYDWGIGANWDYATIQYDAGNGNELWVRRYDGPPGDDHDGAYSLVVDENGNVFVTGGSVGSSWPDYDYCTIKYDVNGNELWVKRYASPFDARDDAWDIGMDGYGNIFVTGKAYNGTSNDYTTIKYDGNGNELWVGSYNGPGDDHDEARVLAVDDSGNVYVTGGSDGSGTGLDYATLKYDQEGLALTVVPDTTDFNRGDMICFTATTSNNADTAINFQAWTEVELPWGSILSPTLGPVNLTFGAYQTMSPYLCDGPIPNNAPITRGYRYIVKLGTYPSTVLEEDSFDFSIVGP